MENSLQVIVQNSGLEKTKAEYILTKFQDYFAVAAEWESRAKGIIVTDASQKADMQMARVGRLFLRDKRIAIENSRKELKEQSLREGKAIDGIANVLKALIVPIEDYLDQQEHFVELKEKAEAEQARIEAERKAEAERIAREQAEREEQERIRVENEQLKAEAVAREKKMEAERKKAEAARLAAEDKARKEKEAIEAKAKAERDQQEKVIREEREKTEFARKEREAFAAKLAMIECPNCHHKFTLNK